MTEEQWAALVPNIITALVGVAGIIGTVFVALAQSRASAKRENLAVKREAYANFLAEIRSARNRNEAARTRFKSHYPEESGLEIPLASTTPLAPGIELPDDVMADVRAARARAMIVGSDEVARVIGEFTYEYEIGLVSGNPRPGSWPEFDAAIAKIERAMRSDLAKAGHR